MSNLILREIINYQTRNDDFVDYKEGNSRSKIKLVCLPMSKNDIQFYAKAKRSKWVTDFFSNIIGFRYICYNTTKMMPGKYLINWVFLLML